VIAVALVAMAVVIAVSPRRREPRRVRLLLDESSHSAAASPNSPVAPSPFHLRVVATATVGRVGHVLRSIRPGAPNRSIRDRDAAAHDVRVGAAALAALTMAVLVPVLALPVAVAVWAIPSFRVRAKHRRRERDLIDEVPAVVELFRLASAAGLSVHLALSVVAARTRGLVSDALSAVIAGESMGEPLADALERLARLGAPVRPLAGALIGAERYGTPLGPTLERVALESRLLRRRRTEEAARRLPVLMLFPLVLCILPAFGLLTVVPLLVASLPHLSS
jgi:tight adherence protein C